MSLPTDSAARKRIPMFTGLLAYFPDALAAVAQHSFNSNEKHNPGEPLHWAREKSADHKDTIIRHMTDIASGADEVEELTAVSWRSLAALRLAIEAVRDPAVPQDGVISGWIKWVASELSNPPVPSGTLVQIELRSGGTIDGKADDFKWRELGAGTIVRYRLIKFPALNPSR